MDTPTYDRIGKGYSKYRRADSRIVDFLIGLLALPEGSIIAEIGAGTGNYTREMAGRGYFMKAIEPSAIMRDQAQDHKNIEWIPGVAEDIPLHNNSVDAVINIMSFHHFTSPEKAFSEMARICRSGPIVLFTFDPRLIARPWIADYFPKVWDITFLVFPPLAEVEESIAMKVKRTVTSHVFELPHDFQDLFVAAGWRRPELFLDPQVRACTSIFALSDQNEINEGVQKLKEDLDNGDWRKKNGWLLSLDRFDVGFRFVCAAAKSVSMEG